MPDLPFDIQGDKDAEEETKLEKAYREINRPADKFYEGYCRYMLLKVKIRYRVFQTAKDLLDETDSCINVLKELGKRIPSQTDNFLKTEIAFILNESMTAISDWVSERELDDDWISKFICESQRIQSTYTELIQYL